MTDYFTTLEAAIPELPQLARRANNGDATARHHAEALMDAYSRDGDKVGYWVGCARARWGQS